MPYLKIRFYLFFVFMVFIICISCNGQQNDSIASHHNAELRRNSLCQKAETAFIYCKSQNMDTTFCLLADMKIHSGKIRFFVWNFQKQLVTDSGMVSHGCGKNPWGKTKTKINPAFSNKDGSHLTSLGKYKIGKRNYSQWGIHVNYLLHGLETSNDNAQKRTIVLHSWDDVPEAEVFPNGTPEGWGCPAINNKLMRRLDKKLKTTTLPVLLWQFYD